MTLKINTPREGAIAQICWIQGMKEALEQQGRLLELILQREVQKLSEYDRSEAVKEAHENSYAQRVGS